MSKAQKSSLRKLQRQATKEANAVARARWDDAFAHAVAQARAVRREREQQRASSQSAISATSAIGGGGDDDGAQESDCDSESSRDEPSPLRFAMQLDVAKVKRFSSDAPGLHKLQTNAFHKD